MNIYISMILASKRVTRAAWLVSIVLGTLVTVFLKLSGSIWPQIMRPLGDANADPFGIPIIYPSLAVSLLSLLVVSMFTRPPNKEVLAKFFPEAKS